MPVLSQIASVTDRFFDAAETANTRLAGKTAELVDGLVERAPSVDLPFADRLPEPAEAVTATFDFIGTGIAFNRSIAERVFDAINPESEEATAAKKAPAAKKPAAKKTAAKKSASAKKS